MGYRPWIRRIIRFWEPQSLASSNDPSWRGGCFEALPTYLEAGGIASSTSLAIFANCNTADVGCHFEYIRNLGSVSPIPNPGYSIQSDFVEKLERICQGQLSESVVGVGYDGYPWPQATDRPVWNPQSWKASRIRAGADTLHGLMEAG